MKTKQIKKISDFIENEIFSTIEGIREEGDYTSENRRSPDTWYHCGLEVNYDSTSKKLSFNTEMIADKDFVDEDGFADEYDNAYVQIEYDVNLDELEVETYSDEESQFMQDILFDLECRIREDDDLSRLIEEAKK
jgi:hypothetical protein